MFTLLVALSTVALAETGAPEASWTVADGFVLEPSTDHFTAEWGISAPTVAWTGTEYVMFFENKMTEEPSDECKSGYQLGRATSPDGITWTLDADPALEPAEGTYYPCVLSQPAVLYDGGQWHLWFAAGQYKDPCPEDTGTETASTEEPPWGCETQTGIGYATSGDGLSWSVSELPIVNRSNLGHPTALRVDDVLEVLYTDADPEQGTIDLVSSEDNGATWTETGVVIEPGLNDWMDDRLSGGSAICDDRETLPIENFFTGKNLDGDNGFGKAVSLDLDAWYFESDSSPFFTQGDAGEPWEENNWSHWDVLRTESGADVLWFSIKDDADNVRKIGMAYTDAGWDTPLPRTCDLVEDTEPPTDTDTDTEETSTDTEPPTDTDEPTDSDVESETDEPTESETDSDTDTGGDSADCGCSAASASSQLVWGLGLMAPLLWRRRRA